ncbi:phospholipase [Sporolactobacillus sp. THM19-2]|nr:phospholipase [Sporolactobacillus sp. THM19-2]
MKSCSGSNDWKRPFRTASFSPCIGSNQTEVVSSYQAEVNEVIYQYNISKPEAVTDETPILITLHGMGTDDHDLAGIVSESPAQFVQINIRGDLRFSSGYTYYLPDFSGQSEQEVITKVLRKIKDSLSDIYEKENLSAKQPVFFLGFSQGAILSLSYSLFYPDCVTGAVILSGRLPEFFKQSDGVRAGKTSFFVAHGQYDPLFSIEIARDTRRYLKQHRFNLSYHEYPSAHGVIPQEVADIRTFLHRLNDRF